MSLESLYDDRIEAAAQRDLRAPTRPPDPSFSTWSMLSAGAKGVPRAAFEVAGSIQDFQRGLDERSALDQNYLRKQRGLPPVDFYVNPGGDPQRAIGQTFAPPESAHMADQVLHNLLRVGSKAALAMATPGGILAGGSLLAAEEGNTAYRELTEKGIDSDTAQKVAAVQGIMTGLSVAIPMAGPTIKATVGLVAAGGPGTYMAQEKLSQQILAKAGYQDEASLHNPLDPLGLALSTLLPAAFGAAHVATRPKAPNLASVVEHLESGGKRYGKDGELLTSPKGAQGEMQVMPKTATDPGFGVAPAKDGSPEELARVGKDYIAAMEQRYPGEPAKALAAYNAGPGTVDALVKKYGDDWASHLPSETKGYVAHGMNKLRDDAKAHVATDPEVVDAARTRVTNDALNRSLPDHMDARAEVMRASEEVAAGRMPEVMPLEGVVTNKHGSFYDTRGDTERFHGTGRQIESLSDDYALSGDNRNIYGQGFYTTDAVDIAAGYMRKGGKESALYRVSHDDVKLYDMEAAVPAEIHAVLAKTMGDVPTHNAETGAPLKSLREIYDEYRAESRNEGLSRDDVQEVFDSIRDNLEQMGYRGFAHVGGEKTGNAPHSVKIFWNPEQHVRLSAADPRDYHPLGSRKSEGTNELPAPEQVALEPPKPETPQAAKPAPVDTKQMVIELRKRESVLNSILECLNG